VVRGSAPKGRPSLRVKGRIQKCENRKVKKGGFEQRSNGSWRPASKGKVCYKEELSQEKNTGIKEKGTCVKGFFQAIGKKGKGTPQIDMQGQSTFPLGGKKKLEKRRCLMSMKKYKEGQKDHLHQRKKKIRRTVVGKGVKNKSPPTFVGGVDQGKRGLTPLPGKKRNSWERLKKRKRKTRPI